MASIQLNIETATAQLLHDYLYDLGEVKAAGAAMPELSAEEERRLGQLLWDLRRALGMRQPYDGERPNIE